MDTYFQDKVAVVTGAGGVICSQVSKGLANLGMTVILVGLTLNELEKVSKSENKTQKKKVKVASHDILSKNVPISLNLIGMRVEEALIQLRNYIDAALLVRYQQVNVIHGFGTGALRKAVHEYLKNCKYVVEYRLGGFNEGGAGATIVVLKGKK